MHAPALQAWLVTRDPPAKRPSPCTLRRMGEGSPAGAADKIDIMKMVPQIPAPPSKRLFAVEVGELTLFERLRRRPGDEPPPVPNL